VQPKNGVRNEHEPAKVWKPAVTPEDNSVQAASFTKYDLSAAYALLKDPSKDLVAGILAPLSEFVLNAKFIEDINYRSTRLSQMIGIFNQAFYLELRKPNKTEAFAKIKANYIATVFAGCSYDLKQDCKNASLFAADSYHTTIMTLLASERDAQIEARLVATKARQKTEQDERNRKCAQDPKTCPKPENLDINRACVTQDADCHKLVSERYQILAMGLYKRSTYQDKRFSFAYMKYASMFAALIEIDKARLDVKTNPNAVSQIDGLSGQEIGYIADLHNNIFQTIVSTYQNADLNNPEFRAFMENANPWAYSNRDVSLFQSGSSMMFAMASKCCIYQDAKRTSFAPNFIRAIYNSQADAPIPKRDENDKIDHIYDVPVLDLSMNQIVSVIKGAQLDIKKNVLLNRLGLASLAAQIDTISKVDFTKPSTVDTNLVNEFQWVVDRFFRDHLSVTEAEMILKNANPERAKVMLPKAVERYVQLYLAYMVIVTNHTMADVFNSSTSTDQIFQTAMDKSQNLTSKWATVQSRIEAINRLMVSYSKTFTSPPVKFAEVDKMVRDVNDNIHMLSVYPNMIAMVYFLSEKNGFLLFNVWWKATPLKIDADNILKVFFDTLLDEVWFPFAKTPKPIQMIPLMYALDYFLSTEAINSFIKTDSTVERAKFFDLIFSHFLGDFVDSVRSKYKGYEQVVDGSSANGLMNQICNYELGKSTTGRQSTINFLSLGNYTYAGLGKNAANSALTNQLTGAADVAKPLLDDIESRRAEVKVMRDVLFQYLKNTGEPLKDYSDNIVTNPTDPALINHPYLKRVNTILKDLSDIEVLTAQKFISTQQHYFDCALRIREVERRRANRIYDEERARLEKIYDAINEVNKITGQTQRQAKIDELNAGFAKNFNPKDSQGEPVVPNKFESIDSSLIYHMSKYDLYMRIKYYVESDIFYNSSSPNEAKFYGKTANDYKLPRLVKVMINDDLITDDMWAKGLNQPITFSADVDTDRAAFAAQGLALLSGKTGSYVSWISQMQSDVTLSNFIDLIERFYILAPIGEGRADQANLNLSAKTMVDNFLKFADALPMDRYDQEYFPILGAAGRFPKEFFQGKWFEKDGFTRRALFFPLQSGLINLAEATLDQRGAYFAAVDYARKFHSLPKFVFNPSPMVQESMTRHYGERVHNRMQKIFDLHAEVLKRQDQADYVINEQYPSLQNPFYYDTVANYWYEKGTSKLADEQKISDQKDVLRLFKQRTDNFYGTATKVTVP
jgi:hypothetical protein